MKGYYKLIDALDKRTTLNIARRCGDRVNYEQVVLTPGHRYPSEDDPLLIQSLMQAEVKRTYSESLEAELKALGIAYNVVTCKSCGGRAKQLTYKVVEWLSDEGDTGCEAEAVP